MADIFDTIDIPAGGGSVVLAPVPASGGDVFDQIAATPAPQAVRASAPVNRPVWRPKPKQARTAQAPKQAAPVAQPIMESKPVSPPSRQVLSGGVETNNWLESLPVVKDYRQAAQSGAWGDFAQSAFKGLPAGPLELADLTSSALNWAGNQGIERGLDWFMPQGLSPLAQEYIRRGLGDTVRQSPLMPPQTNFADQYRQAVNPDNTMPGAFGAGAFIGQGLLPVGTAAKEANLGAKMISAASGGAALTGLSDVGNQYRQTGHVNPLQTLASTALGAGIGAGGTGLVHGAQSGFAALARRLSPQGAEFFGTVQPQAHIEQALADVPGVGPQGVSAMRSIMDLAKQAEMRNFFGAGLAQTPEDALARLDTLTGHGGQAAGAAGPVIQVPPASASGLGRAGDEILATMRAASNLDELMNATEHLSQTVQNIFKGRAKKELTDLIRFAHQDQLRRLSSPAETAHSSTVATPPAAAPIIPSETPTPAPVAGAEAGAPVVAGQQTMGDFRRVLPDEFKGRNKNKLAADLHGHPVYDKAPVRILVGNFGRAKVKVDYTQKRLEDFTRRYIDRFIPQGFEGAEYQLPGGGKLTLASKENASIATRKALAGTREEFETGVHEPTVPTISGTLSKYFGSGPDKIPYSKVAMPSTEAEAAEVLRGLRSEAKAAEKAYEAMKPHHAENALESAKAALERKRNEKGYLKALETAQGGKTEKSRATAAEKIREHQAAMERLEAKVREAEKAHRATRHTEAMLTHMEQELQDLSGDQTAGVHVKTWVPHPEEGRPAIEFALEYRKPTMRKVLDPEQAGQWADMRQGILRQDLNRPRVQQINASMR